MLDPAEPASQDITLTKMIKVAKHFFMVDAMEIETISLLKGTVLLLVEMNQPWWWKPELRVNTIALETLVGSI